MRPLHIRAFANSSVLFSCRFIVHLIASLPQASSFIFGAFPDACVLFPIHFIFLHFLSLPSLITGHYRIFPVLVRSPSGPFHIPSFPLISVFQIRPFPDFFHHFLSFMSPQECILCSFSFLPLPCFFHLSCCISPSLMFPHFPTIPSYVLSFPEDFVFPSHQFVTFRFFCCIISGNSVFHVHHFRYFSLLYVAAFHPLCSVISRKFRQMFSRFRQIPSFISTISVFFSIFFVAFVHLLCSLISQQFRLVFSHFRKTWSFNPTISVISPYFGLHHVRKIFCCFWPSLCSGISQKNCLTFSHFRKIPCCISTIFAIFPSFMLHHIRKIPSCIFTMSVSLF